MDGLVRKVVSYLVMVGVMAVALCEGVRVFAATQDGAPSTSNQETPDKTENSKPAAAVHYVDLSNPHAKVDVSQLAGNNAWMLTASALVLLMTAPGLAMFYGGLVRKKNVLSIIMQCITLMALMSLIWALWGYSLAFGGGAHPNPWIGNGDFLLLRNVESHFDDSSNALIVPIVGKIPRLTHMLFQGMFFIITPGLICGAFAERMKFSTMVIFSILWGTLVYCPLAHWVWGGGMLGYGNDGAIHGGALDFAGGTVVHISSGISALVCAVLIGKRLGHGTEPMPPHNLTYTALGATMLWIGWFGFNAGSQLSCDGIAAGAFAATHFAAAAGTLTWAGMERFFHGKASVLGGCSGAVAGLVCITPASGYVTPISAMIIGVAGGAACYWSCMTLKARFKYDDSLDAFGIHGVGGTLGAILTGVFATRNATSPEFSRGNALGLIDGSQHLLIAQMVATLVTLVFSIVLTFILLKILDATLGLRVTQQQEIQGLDLSQHGEEGYIFY